jgi:hypothetical protein
MKRSGEHQGVPLYVDATLEPYSVVYVPIGRSLMRPYERRRAGELAGTIGSRTPSFPIVRDVEVSVATFAGITPPSGVAGREAVFESSEPVGTTEPEVAPTRLPALVNTPPLADLAPRGVDGGGRSIVRRLTSRDVQRPITDIWLQFDGSRYYNAGFAEPYEPDQFTRIGDYEGFPVYQKRGESNRDIYIPSVEGGLLARYQRR